MSIEKNEPLFTNPLEALRGLSINDLNKYLPAIQKAEDISMTIEKMKEGVFLGLGLDGLKKIPDNSIDLIIADPPVEPWLGTKQRGNPMTIQEYFQWNEQWLKESARVLKPTGAIYLISGWRFSGMYHSLLSPHFHIQTRITWRNSQPKDQPKPMTWINRTSDIWFATKSNEFMFNQEAVTDRKNSMNLANMTEMSVTNLWSDIMDIQVGTTVKMDGDKPEQLIQRILTASSFKLNWVVDPFTLSGGVGVIAKKMGRRFIGFESDNDRLLMAMKRIDSE